jgi:hypothetical protein
MITFLLRAGLFCFAVVVMVRGAEHFELVPAIGWGPDSPAHYLALTGAALGVVLLIAGFMLRWLRWRRAGAR